MKYVTRYQDLDVYQLAQRLAREIFEISKTFPREEMYSLTDQIRRSSRSIGAQIAEAWGKRRYENHYVSKLTDADGERLETEHWLGSASYCKYIEIDVVDRLLDDYTYLGRMLESMMNKSASFCKGFQKPKKS